MTMKPITIKPCRGLRGVLRLPGDKSISHRAAIMAALSPGTTRIEHFLFSDDSLATLDVLAACGIRVSVDKKRSRVVLQSRGILHPSPKKLFMAESGTSARILTGLLAAQPFASRIVAAPSLMKRPMSRVIDPLRAMGANIVASPKGREEFLPLSILPSTLRGICWQQKVASAQVKSAILLAGLFASSTTQIRETVISRDHTERMLAYFGAAIRVSKGRISLKPGSLKTPGRLVIPGDISSAAFFIVAGLIVPGSRIVLKDVGINPTRLGLVRVLQRMGGHIEFLRPRTSWEPVADIEVCASPLKGVVVHSHEVPSLIDEIPVLMVAASLASGETVIRDAGELRVKETDRIRSMVENLKKAGVCIQVKKSASGKESLCTRGAADLRGGDFKSFGDHRTAMSLFVAGLASRGPSRLDDVGCMNKSFPGFIAEMKHLVDR
jgi:3-phosphoshikimate 1-carboxyvinyltransferase